MFFIFYRHLSGNKQKTYKPQNYNGLPTREKIQESYKHGDPNNKAYIS